MSHTDLHKRTEDRVRAAQQQTRRGEKKTEEKRKNSDNKKSKTQLRYPYAMMTDDTDYLRIQIADYKAPGANIEGLVGIADELDAKGKSTGKKEIIANKSFSATSGTSKNTNRALGGGRALKNPLHTIYLPIPQQLSDTNSVNWDNSTLNPIEAFGVAATGKIMSSKDLGDAAANTLSAVELLTKKIGAASGNESIRQAINAAISGAAVGALGGNVSGSQLVSRATGQVFNPNLELLFQGVNLRSFPFTFEFFPRNQKEAEVVKQIIKTLKMSMAPKANRESNAQSGIFISAPRIFQLTYMKGRSSHPFLNKFKPMALTSMDLSYTASNTYSTFYDGTPTHMRLVLNFKELNPIYFEDYQDLNQDGDQSVGY